MDRGEQVFRRVKRQTHRREGDHTRGTLERMEGTKDAIDPLERKSLTLHRDQVVGGLMNQLARFGDELLVQGVHAGAPERTAAWRSRSCCDTGLIR